VAALVRPRSLVAIIVANIPHRWSLYRRVFYLRAFLSDGSRTRPSNTAVLSIGHAATVGTGGQSRKGSNWSQK
jgi:hypothetical protein